MVKLTRSWLWLTCAVVAALAVDDVERWKFRDAARRALECQDAAPTDVIVAFPFVEVFLEEPINYEALDRPEAAINELSPAIVSEIVGKAMVPNSCMVCTLTVLLPRAPELVHPAWSNQTALEPAAEAEEHFRKLYLPRMLPPAAMCFSTAVEVNFRYVRPPARSLQAWQRTMFEATAKLQHRTSQPRVMLFIEATVRPVFTEKFVAGLSRAATRNVVAGCPVYQPNGTVWHTYGYEAMRVNARRGVQLTRGFAGVRAQPGDLENAVVSSACFATYWSNFQKSSLGAAQADQQLLQTFQTKLARHLLTVGALRHVLDVIGRLNHIVHVRSNALLELVQGSSTEQRIRPTIDKAKHQIGEAFSRYTAALAELNGAFSRAQSVLETREVPLHPAMNTVQVIVQSREPSAHRVMCQDPAVLDWIVNSSVKSAPCVVRNKDETRFCMDGEQSFATMIEYYEGDLSQDVVDSSRLPTYKDAEALFKDVMDAVSDINRQVAEGALPASARGCPSDPNAPVSAANCQMVMSSFARGLNKLRQDVMAAVEAASSGARETQITALAACPARHHADAFLQMLFAWRKARVQMVVVKNAPARLVELPLTLDDIGAELAAGVKPAVGVKPIIRFKSLLHLQSIELPTPSADFQVAFDEAFPPSVAPRPLSAEAIAAIGAKAKDYASLALVDSMSSYLSNGVRVFWYLPCCRCCGFATEGAWILRGLRRLIDTVSPMPAVCYCPQPEIWQEVLWSMYMTAGDASHYLLGPSSSTSPAQSRKINIVVHHWDPINALRMFDVQVGTVHPQHYLIGRVMYEFSSIPSAWHDPLKHQYNEVWVPTETMRAPLVAAGIPREKIVIIPEPVDTELFNPDISEAIDLPREITTRGWRHSTMGGMRNGKPLTDAQLSKNFKFLSVFKLEPRKGWDALLTAYFEAFSADEPVSLYIVTELFAMYGAVNASVDGLRALLGDRKTHEEFAKLLRDPHLLKFEFEKCLFQRLMHIDRAKDRHIVIITEPISDVDMASMYRSVDAFILPSRGEGWGLPIIQAMAMGIPTITTKHSGMLQFTTPSTVLYVDVDEVEPPADALRLYDAPPGVRWGDPNMPSLVRAMRKVVQMPLAERNALGSRARDHVVEHFTVDAVGALIAKRVVEIEVLVREAFKARGGQDNANQPQPSGPDDDDDEEAALSSP